MNENIKCPGCGALKDFKEVERVEGFLLMRCQVCDLDFSDPMKNPGGEWYNSAYIIRHSAIDDRIRDYYRWTLSALPMRGNLLDMGCGEGVFVNFARKNGFDAYGVDFSEEAVRLGKMHYGLDTLFNCAPSALRDSKAPDGFDAVTFFEVLEHLDRPAEFIGEARGLLKQGGYVALSVPYRDRWPIREFNDYPPHHLTRWTEKALRIFMESNGFEVINTRIGSGLASYHAFLGYIPRSLVYMLFGMYGKGLRKTSHGATLVFASPVAKRFLSLLRLRQIRDMVLWPFALATYPFFFRWFKGYNIALMARKK